MIGSVTKNIELTRQEYDDLKNYCKLNKLDEDKVLKKSYTQGFQIEKYGLLSNDSKPIVEEIIKEVEVEKIVEVVKEIPIEKVVEIIKEVPVEKLVEIIKEVPGPTTEVKVVEYVDREVIVEVPVEKIVEKIVNIYDNAQIDDLVKKIELLENQPPKIIEKVKEVVIEIPKEIIIEKEVIKEVPKEIIVEKEIIKEVIVKQDESKSKMIEETLHNLRLELLSKDKKINELQTKLSEISKSKFNMGAVYLRGSNLDETLMK
jgi:hypothetical protein